MKLMAGCLLTAVLIIALLAMAHGQSQLWTSIGSVPVDSYSLSSTLYKSLTSMAIGRNNSVYLTTDTTSGACVYTYLSGKMWSQVAGSANSNTGYDYNLMIDAEERPVIVYVASSKPYAKIATNGAWGLFGFNSNPIVAAAYVSPHMESRMASNGDVYAAGLSSPYSTLLPLVYKYSVSSLSWSQVTMDGMNGSTVLDTGTSWNNRISLALNPVDDLPFLAYSDGGMSGKATVLKRTATSWSIVGVRGFSPAAVGIYVSIDVDSSGVPYVAFADYAQSLRVTVMRFVSGAWSLVGAAGFSPDVVTSVEGQSFVHLRIARNIAGDRIYVAFPEGVSGSTTVMQYNAQSNGWIVVGNRRFSVSCTNQAMRDFKIDSKGTLYVAVGATVYMAVCSGGHELSANSSCSPCAAGQFSNLAYCQSCPLGSYSGPAANSCTRCPAGTFTASAGSTMCRPCAAGSYAAGNGSTSCSACPSGSFSNSSGSDSCYACARGTFSSSPNVSSCTACPVGKFASVEGSTSCTNCVAGSFADAVRSTSCVPCSPGFYSSLPGASTPCTACSAGFYSNVTGSTSCTMCAPNMFNPFLAQSDCLPCAGAPAGATSCSSTCPAGTIPNNASQCIACPPGTYASANSYTCRPCPAGSFALSANSASCTLCPIGSYNPFEGSSSPCLPCSTSSSTGWAQCPPPPNATVLCPAGSSFNGSNCQPCGTGFYSPGGGSGCIACPAGTFSTQMNASVCTLCPVKMYNPFVGRNSCLECSTSNSSGLSTCPISTQNCTVLPMTQNGSLCPVFISCTAGRFFDGMICRGCNAGFYSVAGANNCTICPPGTYAPQVNASTCLPCPNGTANPLFGQAVCPPCATALTAGLATCPPAVPPAPNCTNPQRQSFSCPSGTFSNGSQCLSCTAGFYSVGNASVCLPCPVGTFAAGKGSTNCSLCSAGSFNPLVGQTSCLPCSTATSIGQAVCQPMNCTAPAPATTCPAGSSLHGSTCQPCGPGFYSPGSGSACIACPVGTFSASVNASICTLCPLKTYNPFIGRNGCLDCSSSNTSGLATCPPLAQNCSVVPTAQNCSNVPTAQNCSVVVPAMQNMSVCPVFISCPAGSFFDGAVCRGCSAGLYSVAGSNICTVCPTGSYAPQENSSTCLPCPLGSANPLVGQVACSPCATALNTGLSSCPPAVPSSSNCTNPQTQTISCPSGTFSNGSNCPSCAAGFYSVGNVSDCLPCPVGTFAAGKGSWNCSLCPSGSYNPLVGQVSCVPCATASVAGQSSCLPATECPAGQFVSGGICRDCPAGFYSVMGMSACVACPAGTYSMNPRSTGCQMCPTNTFNPLIGRSSIVDCFNCTASSASKIGSSSTLVATTGRIESENKYHVEFAHEGSSTCDSQYSSCPPKAEGPRQQKTSSAFVSDFKACIVTVVVLLFLAFMA